MNPQEFLEFVRKDCAQKGVRVIFVNTPKVSYGPGAQRQVSGYFDDKEPVTLACALGKPEEDWMIILPHESCHMDQWFENDPLWVKQREGGGDCDLDLDDWLDGKDIVGKDPNHFVRVMQNLEIDCEKRTVKKIKDLDLPINIPQYIKNANAYLFFYTVLLKTRRWSDTPPYMVKEILDRMPDHFLDDYSTVSDDLLELYRKHCYN